MELIFPSHQHHDRQRSASPLSLPSLFIHRADPPMTSGVPHSRSVSCVRGEGSGTSVE